MMIRKNARSLRGIVRGACALALILGAAASASAGEAGDAQATFTIAVLPDTQFYTDFLHQTEEGFPFDAREMFYDQMDYIARNSRSQGGDIAFVSMVGDVWEHPTRRIDPEHEARGFRHVPSVITDHPEIAPDPRTLSVELPIARRAFDIIAGKVPFSVVPGNHDYDANWSDSKFPPAPDLSKPEGYDFPYGMLAYGGLENFNSVFGAKTPYFAGKDWYVAHYNDGANSAQIFTAGGYRFLHIGLEMAPADDVLEWAEGVIKAHPGLPTIVTTHDMLDPKGERRPLREVDFKAVDARHNNPEDVWQKFVSRHDQIFLVLSGHQYGQSRRVDMNHAGHPVHQVLADYQDRHQTVLTADPDHKGSHVGIGDGWLRLMRFELGGAQPRIVVSTYSTHYKAAADELPRYSAFYKAAEKPGLSDEDFIGQEQFDLPLGDFAARFAGAKVPAAR